MPVVSRSKWAIQWPQCVNSSAATSAVLTSILVDQITTTANVDSGLAGSDERNETASVVGVLVDPHAAVDLCGAEHLLLEVLAST